MSWRTRITDEFIPGIASLTLVSDPDGLMAEQGILQEVLARGFEVIYFDDPISFRFEYETRYRTRKERTIGLVVVVHGGSEKLAHIPYDLLQASRRLSFNLGEIFPNLSYPVLKKLDLGALDALFSAYTHYAKEPLGDNSTKDFILMHVYDLIPTQLKDPADLLKALLTKHFKNITLPSVLEERFVEVLLNEKKFTEWPLGVLITDREALFGFLQERWPIFIDSIAGTEGDVVSEAVSPYRMKYPGPVELPLDRSDVRAFIDTLFLEGTLRPIRHPRAGSLAGKWFAVGLVIDPETDKLQRLQRLLERVANTVPARDCAYQGWLEYARSYAEMNFLFYEMGAPTRFAGRIEELRERANEVFIEWALKRYSGLHDQPPVPPVMLHHLPRALARWIEGGETRRIALVLIDGLAVEQWSIIREALLKREKCLGFRESVVFAWVPTLTSVSRQAAFSGLKPLYFGKSLLYTAKDRKHWIKFWTGECGFFDKEVDFISLGGDVEDGGLASIEELASNTDIRALAIVIRKIDKIMHGMEMGSLGMHQQVSLWADTDFMGRLLEILHNGGFDVFITSDHGNLYSAGIGKPSEGQLAEEKGQRVRIYPNEILRSKIAKDFPDALEWPSISLPEDHLALLAPYRGAFIQEGSSTVTHGGLSIEEVLVPWIQVEWDNS